MGTNKVSARTVRCERAAISVLIGDIRLLGSHDPRDIFDAVRDFIAGACEPDLKLEYSHG